MTEPFVGQIKIFAGNFAPRGWALCDGQLLSISQNDALFSLLGTTYGGDGRNTFGLPDLRGRIPVHQGQGAGLTRRLLGAKGGSETVSIGSNQMPVHNHPAKSATGGDHITPVGNYWSTDPGGNSAGYHTGNDGAMLAADLIGSVGGGQPHDNVAPFLCVHFIISLFGIFPSRQ